MTQKFNINKLMLCIFMLCVLPISSFAVIPTDSNEAYYGFDGSQISGSTINNDITGTTPTGTIVGNVIQNSTGLLNDALSFPADGSSYISLGSSTDFLDNNAGSFSGWIYPESTGGTLFIFFKGTGPNNVRMDLAIFNDGRVSFAGRQVGGGNPDVWSMQSDFGSINLTSPRWYHVGATYNVSSSTASLYLDGVKVNNVSSYGNTLDPTNYPTYLGIRGDFNSLTDFKGRMDEVSFWNEELSDAQILELNNSGVPLPYDYNLNPAITLINPTQNENITFDVTSTTLNITTDVSTSCEYTYNATTLPLTPSNGNLTHTANFVMGNATNSTKQFDITYLCLDTTDNSLNTTQGLTFFQNQVPLSLEIFVPIDQQQFIRPINAIEFNIETNYQANCQYQVTNLTSIVNFSSTNSNVHKTNYSTLFPTIDTYPLTFYCQGTILNESLNSSLTFFLIDDEISATATLTQTTGQLPQVGSDVGGFLQQVTPGITGFVFTFAIIGSIILIVGGFVLVIVRGVRTMNKRGAKR